MGGSPNTGTQTTTSQPSYQAQQIMDAALPFAKNYATAGGVQLGDLGVPIAPFNPNQTAGQNMALTAGQGVQQTAANNASGAQSFLTTGAALDPSSNPGLAASILAAQKPLQQQLTESTLPSLRSNATAVGDLGSSREGIAEGLAARGTEQAQGKIASDMTYANYMNALDQMTKAMGLTPTVQTAQITPATTISGVGDTQQAMDQALRSYYYGANVFQQQQPLSIAEALTGIASSAPGGTTTANASGSNNPNMMQTLLGLGTLGTGLFGSKGALAGLGGLFGSGAGTAAGGAGAAATAGAEGGGTAAELLPLLLAIA